MFTGESIELFRRFGGLALFGVLFLSGFATSRRAFFDGCNTAVLFPAIGAALWLVLIMLRRLSARSASASGRLMRGEYSNTLARFSWVILVLLQLFLSVEFLRTAQGRLIFTDDHPSFLYRLKMLVDHFPHVPFYNTDWNAGYIAYEFALVGIYGAFLLSWPLLLLSPEFGTVDGSFAYTLLIPYLYLFVVPWAVYAGGRVIRLHPFVALICGVFALGPSLLQSEWMLKYGTIGFVLTSGFVPVLYAFAYRVFFDEQAPRMLHALALGIVGFLAVAWPMASLLTVPILVFLLLRPRVLAKRFRFVVTAGVLFAVLAGPMFEQLIFRTHAVSVVRAKAAPGASWTVKAAEEEIGQGVRENQYSFKMLVRQTNPLLLAFVIPGLFAFPRRERYYWSAAILWVFGLAAFGDHLKPQLEFRRLLLPCVFLSIYPAAAGIGSLLRSAVTLVSNSSITSRVTIAGAAVIAAALVLSPLPVRAALKNRPVDPNLHYTFANDEVSRLSELIRTQGGEGRTMFLGFVLHELGSTAHDNTDGGHVAALASFTGKELFAYYFYHYSWTSTDPTPLSIRSGSDEGVEGFLDLLNVTSVITFDATWRRYCKRQSNYTELYKSDRFRIFKRESSGLGPFFRGAGRVERSLRGLVVTPESEESVIKYRYYPSLVTDSSDAQIYPVRAYENDLPDGTKEQIDYIGLRMSPSAVRDRRAVTISLE